MSQHTYDPNGAHRTRRARWVLWSTLLGLLVFFTWAAFARINQVAHAQGTVIASAKTQIIQAPDGGVLTKLLVKEGDTVKAGQLLAQLERERAQAAVDDTASKVATLRISVARLEAEVYEKPLAFPDDLARYPELIQAQRDLYLKRRAAISGQLASLQKMSALARQELALNEPLLAMGDVSQADVIRLRRQVADIEAQMTNARNKYFEDAQTQLLKAQEELNSQTEVLRDRSQLLEHTDLRAAIGGIVKNIRVTTLGGVLRPGDVLMELVPTGDDLVVEGKISPADIAFVKVGQAAHVKLDAYDYSIFGAMQGRVIYISPDTLIEETKNGPSSFYRVHVRISGNEYKGNTNEQVEIRPGMTAQVDIRLRDRTVLSYLTKPVTKMLNQSLGDR